MKGASGSFYWYSSKSIPNGKWVHITITAKPDEAEGIMYMDGAVVTGSLTATAPGNPTYAAAPTIGMRGDVGGGNYQYWDGKIAQLCVWNTALTAAEIEVVAKC